MTRQKPVDPAGSEMPRAGRTHEVRAQGAGAQHGAPVPAAQGRVVEKRISVVLPVYNEKDNIEACLRGLYEALETSEHEILVCYDFDEDTTLAGIAAMKDVPPSVRLVRNRIGRGAANAIRAGFQAASGDVCVTTMADLCDPPAVIPALAAKVREGAAVVSGSRYMPGGSQTGGPFLKQLFSRCAGLSLRWVAGMGTHDPTNNFRAYARSFLDRVSIESQTAFDIALELTTKAHLQGDVVAEVPSSWRDRSAGTSRFQMWKWMPNYLRWYWDAMLPPLLVWTVWLGLLVAAFCFLYDHASGIPFADDLEMVAAFTPEWVRSPEWYWGLHNEHRIPLPRWVFVTLLDITRDFRAPMYAEVAVLGFLSAAMILAMRRIRGRTSYVDAFFPFLWLHWGNYENLLMAFQISLMLPVTFGCLVWMIAAAGKSVPRKGATIAIGTCLLMLPLCGGHGLTQVPALTAWLGLAGLYTLRSKERDERRKGWWMVAFATASCLLVAAYFYQYQPPPGQERADSVGKVLLTAAQFLTLSIGPGALHYWPYSGYGVLALSIATMWILGRTIVTRPEERLRAAAIVAGFGGIVSMALAAGYGRAGEYDRFGFAMRYVSLPSPILACAFFAFALYASPAFSRFVRFLLYSTMAILYLFNAQRGTDYATWRAHDAHLFATDLAAGFTSDELAAKYWEKFYPSQEGFAFRLKMLAHAGLMQIPGDDRVVVPTPENAPSLDRPYFMFGTRPFAVHSTKDVFARLVDEEWVLMVPPDGEVRFTLSPASRSVGGRFGIHPLAWRNSIDNVTDGVRFTVELVPFTSPVVVLFERVLDPVATPEDGGFQFFEVELPAEHEGHLVLRTTNLEGRSGDMDWAFWTDVSIR
jgi:glycosyltransferase involved in cell wall biosynthesis